MMLCLSFFFILPLLIIIVCFVRNRKRIKETVFGIKRDKYKSVQVSHSSSVAAATNATLSAACPNTVITLDMTSATKSTASSATTAAATNYDDEFKKEKKRRCFLFAGLRNIFNRVGGSGDGVNHSHQQLLWQQQQQQQQQHQELLQHLPVNLADSCKFVINPNKETISVSKEDSKINQVTDNNKCKSQEQRTGLYEFPIMKMIEKSK
ncbi:hypothetical protein HELRODRAFT_184017 [Helobdella robusta]|uniref:G-protein coupled receptors family 1 profile domain-containing protein n=1 Tax=Helobdella robusta TaxID=6412 RepID=T1FKF5_HELRO|nr:hypothetical protein HELRODRAFT_184017 [Helobdella robusta]ESO09627.1 hypothetical protein HELRODRAFT_184017 [Helobdella robusta]